MKYTVRAALTPVATGNMRKKIEWISEDKGDQ